MLSSDSPAKTTKTSINIDFLPLFHVKHCLKPHKLTSLNPSALPHDRRRSKDKAYRAVQTRALHSLAIIPRNLHGVPHSIQFRVDLNTLTRSRSIRNRDKRSLRNAAQPLARCGYIYVTRTQPHGACLQSAHSQLSRFAPYYFIL